MGEGLGVQANARLALRALRLDLSNFHLIHYRWLDGILATGKHSGSHWLKWLLSNALAHQYGLPPPQYSSGPTADEFVGHPKLPWKHSGLPRIGFSHNMPSTLLNLAPVRRAISVPPIVVLVRDIPQALVSHYVKRVHRHRLTLSEYVRTPAPGRRGPSDVWWYIDFFNRWGAFAAARPGDALLIRYEDLIADTARSFRLVVDHFGLRLEPTAIEAALAVSGRETVRARLDPRDQEVVVPDEAERYAVTLSPEDEAYLRDLLGAQLHYDFGYGYAGARGADASGTGMPSRNRPQSVA